MLFAMSGSEQKTPIEPAVIVAPGAQPTSLDGNASRKVRLTRKHVVIAAVALLVTGLIVTGALVGIKIYTDSNLEIVKYTLKANGLSQNVSVDNNVVTYHVQKEGVEAWIVQDFDRGIQVTKQLIDGKTNCYVTALNRSIAADASSIPDTTPDTTGASSSSVIYKVLPDRIADLAFLGKKASAMCQNIPTYHAVPECGKPDDSNTKVDNSTAVGHRRKRTPAICASCNQPNCLCICGCCGMVCADYSQGGTVCTWYYNPYNRSWTCTFYYRRLYAIYLMSWPYCSYNGRYYLP